MKICLHLEEKFIPKYCIISKQFLVENLYLKRIYSKWKSNWNWDKHSTEKERKKKNKKSEKADKNSKWYKQVIE